MNPIKAIGNLVNKGVEAVSDWADDNGLEMVSDFMDKTADRLGAEREPAKITRTKHGATADIDYSKLPENQQATAKSMGDELATNVDKLDRKIAEARSNGAPRGELVKLESQRMEANERLTNFKFECEHVDIKPGQALALGLGAFIVPGGALVMDSMIDAKADFSDVKAEYMAATGQLSDSNPPHVPAPGAMEAEVKLPEGAKLTSKDAAGGSKGVGGGKEVEEGKKEQGAEGAGGGTSAGSNIESLANLATTDPDAFMAKLNDMPHEERMLMMQSVNTHLQSINQMFSMMSNIAKTQHDTAKAIINNMRV